MLRENNCGAKNESQWILGLFSKNEDKIKTWLDESKFRFVLSLSFFFFFCFGFYCFYHQNPLYKYCLGYAPDKVDKSQIENCMAHTHTHTQKSWTKILEIYGGIHFLNNTMIVSSHLRVVFISLSSCSQMPQTGLL